MPRLEEWEIKKYWEIFQGLKPENNRLTGDRVSPVLKNSRLPDAQLSRIWDLADIDLDGQLDFEEFCIAMRLIFDTVNGSAEVPLELPNWLVPLSKAHLIQANRAVALGSNSGEQPVLDDDDDMLLDDFDWYISPSDKLTYEAIYNSNSDQYGRVRFDSLEGLYGTLAKVPRDDLLLAWNLVNPKLFETIDKDQVLVYLHILNQRENGKRVPRGVPALLRATFSKEVPSYDLSVAPKPVTPSANNKTAFGTSYLNKIGQTQPERGTDFSATEGTDWEEVRLKKELAHLEELLAKTHKESAASGLQLATEKHEFEQFLKYKQLQLQQAQAQPHTDMAAVRGDVDLIESQLKMLEGYLAERQKELGQLQQEIASM